jgi:bis(5'-nucleosyl)-tetraphosphatase (symmetrical)
MAVYAIGDVQGCYDELAALLAQLRFDRARDTLWFTGDLVNRGPRSADVVRFVKDLGGNAITVLGNHDLHLLAVAAGVCARGATDTFADLLGAEDRDVLLDWLRARPLLYHGAGLGFTLIHAGLLPQWDLGRARALAAEVEVQLRGPAYSELLHHMYGDAPDSWDDSLSGWNRVRVIINAFTRLRYCDRDGRMDLRPVGAPGSQPRHLIPWFQIPQRRSRNLTVIFGHWSTLGVWQRDGVIALDTGCLWGGALTAVRLDSAPRQFFRVRCAQHQAS